MNSVTFGASVPIVNTTATHKVYLASVQLSVNKAFSSALVRKGFLNKLTKYIVESTPGSPPPVEALHEDNSPDMVEPRKSELLER